MAKNAESTPKTTPEKTPAESTLLAEYQERVWKGDAWQSPEAISRGLELQTKLAAGVLGVRLEQVAPNVETVTSEDHVAAAAAAEEIAAGGEKAPVISNVGVGEQVESPADTNGTAVIEQPAPVADATSTSKDK